MSGLTVSVGICAYNEEANIGKLLEALLRQETAQVGIGELVVVSSACTDRTNEIVRSFQEKHPQIVLIEQAQREGKASAINLFLREAKNDLCVLISADTIPFENAVEFISLPFVDGKVGMAGGHPVPVDNPSTFMGFVTHLIWDLAHGVSLETPKLGEFIAFRNIIGEIPIESAVDEARIEAMIKERGYQVRYVPEAYVYNKGPDNVGDFIKQRRRIYAGHLHLKKTTGYEVSSLSSARVARLVLRGLKLTPKDILWTVGAALLEAHSRFLGYYDVYLRKRNPYIWPISSSTKELIHDRDSVSSPPV